MRCVIFGAGKIARGFVGHLLYLSHIPFTFVEYSQPLVELLNRQGRYTVHVFGAPERSGVVEGFETLGYSEHERVAERIAECDTVFTAIGGKNLESAAPLLAEGLSLRADRLGGAVNIVTCENWKQPAEILRAAVRAAMPEGKRVWLDENAGFTEAVVMRSGIEPSAAQLACDPLWVNVSNFWEMPVDAERLKRPFPPVLGAAPKTGFSDFLERKFYTYNAANGTVSYLGALLGFTTLSDAAWDERIAGLLENVYRETATALCRKHGVSFDEQWAFVATSRNKLRDRDILDTIERNARDPMRKLGPNDRLVGSARMVLETGVRPEALAVAIAAAIHYPLLSETDPSARQLARLREEKGTAGVLSEVCMLDPGGELGRLVLEKEALMKEWGWIRDEN